MIERDEATGLVLDIDVSPDVPCVLVPRVAEAGAECRTTDVGALADKLESSGDPILYAVRVDRGDWAYVLVLSRRPGGGELDDREIRAIGEHIREGLQKPNVEVTQPSPATTVMRSDDNVQIVTAPITLSAAGASRVRIASHFISGAGRYTLTTTTDEAHAAEVDAIAERVLRTVKLDPAESTSNASPLAASVSYSVTAALVLALIVAAVVIVRRVARRV